MKKILIISPDSNHFVREYIENVLVKPDYDVTFFTISRNKADIKFYEENNIKYIGIKKDNNRTKIGNVKGYFKSYIWLINNRNQYDVIHIHFMDVRFLSFCKGLLKSTAKLVITFWGSDLLRDAVSNYKTAQAFKPWIEKASAINLMDNHSKGVFDELYSDVNTDKAIVLDFGDSLFDKIDKEVDTLGKDKAKEKYNLPIDKVIVHIGHNGSVAHQHIKLLETLNNLPQKYKDNLYLVMHFGYSIGGYGYSKEEYIDAVNKAASDTEIAYKIITDYITGKDMADFRLTADIMLYGQLTDAISASVVETVYAGGYFINPIWLDYSQFKEQGIKYAEYSEFEEIQEIIEQFLDGNRLSEKDLKLNREAIKKLKGWDFLAPKWRELYED